MNKKYYVLTFNGSYPSEFPAGPLTQPMVEKEIARAKALYLNYIVFDSSSISRSKKNIRKDLSRLITGFVANPNQTNGRKIFSFLRAVYRTADPSSCNEEIGKNAQSLLQCKGTGVLHDDDCRGCSYSIVGPQIIQSFQPVVTQLGRAHALDMWKYKFSQWAYNSDKQHKLPMRNCPIVALMEIAGLINLTKRSKNELGLLIPPMLELLSILSNPPHLLNETKEDSEKK